MRPVSYQLPTPDEQPAAPAHRALDPGAIDTRRRDATDALSVTISPAQRRWLRRTARDSGVDVDDVVRALLDLGSELGLDWTAIDGPKALRAAVRDGVLVRAPAP